MKEENKTPEKKKNIKSAVVRDCNISNCQYHRLDGTCKLPYITINILKMCGYVNTKIFIEDDSAVLREFNE